MLNHDLLSESKILAIIHPEQLFTGDRDTATKEYRKLCKKWHTDLNPLVDPRVITHINVLYDKALVKLKQGIWEIPGVFTIKTIDGKKFNLSYHKKHLIDVGEMYISSGFVTFSLHKDNADLFAKGKSTIKGFKFPDDKMKTEFSRFLPEIVAEHETEDRLVMIVKKTAEVMCLADVIEFYDRKFDPKHGAWVISRLYNLACFLKFSGIVHSGISPKSIFISPEHHSVMLLGDWWYATKVNEHLVALPARTASLLSDRILTKKLATHEIDLELIRSVGREMLGDLNGSKLLMDKSLPNALVSWARSPATNDAYIEYEQWQQKVLIDSFGKRKFIKLEVNPSEVYEKVSS